MQAVWSFGLRRVSITEATGGAKASYGFSCHEGILESLCSAIRVSRVLEHATIVLPPASAPSKSAQEDGIDRRPTKTALRLIQE